ncbi:hypothetical protein P7H16_23470 [Paenibacillus larvae]|nr:hypothetical protein [Paenibacillus larvae]MDT2249276.1 hypothetical protein [Paenibacillus larvae]
MTWTGTEWLKRGKQELIRKYTELIDAMAANENRLTESELAELDESNQTRKADGTYPPGRA